MVPLDLSHPVFSGSVMQVWFGGFFRSFFAPTASPEISVPLIIGFQVPSENKMGGPEEAGPFELKLLMAFSLTRPFIFHNKKSVGKCCFHCKNMFDFFFFNLHTPFILILH